MRANASLYKRHSRSVFRYRHMHGPRLLHLQVPRYTIGFLGGGLSIAHGMHLVLGIGKVFKQLMGGQFGAMDVATGHGQILHTHTVHGSRMCIVFPTVN